MFLFEKSQKKESDLKFLADPDKRPHMLLQADIKATHKESTMWFVLNSEVFHSPDLFSI